MTGAENTDQAKGVLLEWDEVGQYWGEPGLGRP